MRGSRDHIGMESPKTRKKADPDVLQLSMVEILLRWEIRTLQHDNVMRNLVLQPVTW